jgi:Right handed beta helix region
MVSPMSLHGLSYFCVRRVEANLTATFRLAAVLLCTMLIAGCGARISGPAISKSDSTSTRIFSVIAFGALGNGIADDAPAIQHALQAASASPGSLVSFPCGEFSLRSVAGAAPGNRSLLYVNAASDVQVQGQGQCTHVFTALPQKSVLEFEDSDHIAVSDMKISALNASYIETYGMDGGSAIRFTGVTYGSITGVEVDGATAGALYFTKGTSQSSMTNNFVHDTYGSGIWEDDCGSASAVSCAPSTPPTNNVYQSNILTNTSLEMSTAMAMDDGGHSSYAVVKGNTIAWTRPLVAGNDSVFCIQINNASDVNVANNDCNATPYDGIVITTGPGGQSQRVTIQGNTIRSSGTLGVGGSGIAVYNGAQGNGISGFAITGNTITTAMDDGIFVEPVIAGSIYGGQIMNNSIYLADQGSPGTRFGINVVNSASIIIQSNAIACNGRCIAAGVNIRNSPLTDPGLLSNQVTDILGPPLVIQ